MGKVLSRLHKEYYRFNAENRAHRFLDKGEFKVAPKHPATIKHMEAVMPDPSVVEDLSKKHSELDDNLKKVFLKSFDPPMKAQYGKPSDKARMLPVDRTIKEDDILFGHDPEHIPEGKLSLKQAMRLLTDHQEDPDKHNLPTLSQQYKLSLEDTANILTYFSNFRIHIPESSKGKVTGKSSRVTFLKSAKPKEPVLSIEEKKEDK